MVVAPALAYGSSGEHAGFPGTLSIGQAALELVLVELIRSADAFAGCADRVGPWWQRPPRAPGGRSADRRGAPGAGLAATSAGDPTDTHAGHTETSLVLALRPAERTRRTGGAPGNRQPLDELWPALRRHGVAAVSPNGVLGDPTGASAAAGDGICSTPGRPIWPQPDSGWP